MHHQDASASFAMRSSALHLFRVVAEVALCGACGSVAIGYMYISIYILCILCIAFELTPHRYWTKNTFHVLFPLLITQSYGGIHLWMAKKPKNKFV